MAVRMVSAIARTIPTVSGFSAMCPLLVPGCRIFIGNNRRGCVSYFTLRWDTSARVVAVKATAAILCGKSRSLGFIFTYAAHTQFVQFRPNTQTGHANVEETVNRTKLLTKVS